MYFSSQLGLKSVCIRFIKRRKYENKARYDIYNVPTSFHHILMKDLNIAKFKLFAYFKVSFVTLEWNKYIF